MDGANGDRPRVLVVGEDGLARAGLAAALAGEGAVEVVGAVAPGDPRALLLGESATVLLWDAGVVGDPELPEFDVPTVVLVAREEHGAAARATGARGVLLRSGDGARLAAAIIAVANGLVVIDEDLVEAVVVRDRGEPDAIPDALTEREREVLELLSMGYTNRELGDRLGISVHTAKFHVNAILEKLDATTRTEAVVRAARLGLLLL